MYTEELLEDCLAFLLLGEQEKVKLLLKDNVWLQGKELVFAW